MTSTRPDRRRSEDGRRAELIAAASRVIARDGLAGATTRRIAAEAGVPPGLVHYWFADKNDLLMAVINDTLGPIEAAVSAGTAATRDDDASSLDRLRAAFQVMQGDDRGRQIAMYEMTAFALRDEHLTDVARHQYRTYQRVAAESVSSWADTANAQLPADPAVVGQFLAALVDGLMLAWLVNPETTDVDSVLTLVSTLLDQQIGQPHTET